MTTQTIVFDKFAFVQTLEKRGYARAQAEAMAEAVTDIALANLVSKSDLNTAVGEVRGEIGKLRFDLLKHMFAAMAAQIALIVALIELLK